MKLSTKLLGVLLVLLLISISSASIAASIGKTTDNTAIISVTFSGTGGQTSIPIVNISASNSTLDSSQIETLTASVQNSTGPYTYNFSVLDASTNQTVIASGQQSGSSFTFNTGIAGNLTTELYARVNVTNSTGDVGVSSNLSIDVNTAPVITIIQSINKTEPGQNETYFIDIGGGTGPFNVELYNETGSASQGKNITTNSNEFQANESVGDTLYNQSVVLPQGYETYLCEGAANFSFSSVNPFSWTNDTGGIISSIGHQSSNICVTNSTNSELPGTAMAGIGFNEPVSSYSFYDTLTSLSPTASQLSYTIDSSNSFVVIMAAGGFGTPSHGPPYGPITGVQLESSQNCQQVIFANNSDQSEGVYIAVCNAKNPGTYYAQINQTGGTTISAAAYVFNSMPSGGAGNVSFNTSIVGNFLFKAIATDDGTSTPFIFNSSSSELNVYTPLRQPIISLSASNTILDSGQIETFNITVNASNSLNLETNTPFEVKLSNLTGSVQQGNSVLIPGYGGSNTISFTTSYNAIFNIFDYYALSLTANNTAIGSNSVAITVDTVPSITLSASNATLHSGQNESFTITLNSGVGPFSFELLNVTGNAQQGGNVLLSESNNTNTISFTAGSVGNYTFETVSVDNSPTTPYYFNSTKLTITVSNPATGGSGAFTGGAPSSGGNPVVTSQPSISISKYDNGSQKGYEIYNLSQQDSETLTFDNNAKIVKFTVDFLTPTSAEVTVNNQELTLTIGEPVAFVDPDNYTYYIELADIDYVPVGETITLIVYGRPNAAVLAVNTSSQNTNSTIKQVPKEPPANTITPATPQASSPTNQHNTFVTTVPQRFDYALVFGAAIIVLIIVVPFTMIIMRTRKGRKGAQRRGQK